jgi:glycosyltransferase involved in cell wall biosynthesis
LHGERPDSNALKGKPFNILVLGGLSPHKNVTKLVPVVSELLQSDVSEFKILISCKRDEFLALFNTTNVNSAVLDKFTFLGIIEATEIDSVYRDADILLNLSDLESFSNNYMEAWKAGIPLICSKRDFAKSICGDSAVYVEPHDAASVASGINKVIYNS